MRNWGRVGLVRFRCADCAYGASAAEPPPRCPMCGGTRWQEEKWRATERLHADLRPDRAPAAAPVLAGDAPANGQPARLAFRNLNEKIRWLQLREANEQLDLLCECDEPHCFAPLSIGVVDYERLRTDPEQFLVLPGHEPSSLAEVVEVGLRYVIVRLQPPSPGPSTSEVATTVEERESESARGA